MNQTLNLLKFSRCKNTLFFESRRFAGHSKWANIKHIKEEKDGQKSEVYRKLTNKMRVAIAEGGSAKPSENLKLTQLINQAKKANMPAATLNNFLEKMTSNKDKTQNVMLPVHGPGGCIMLLKVMTHNLILTKANIQSKLKKFGAKLGEPSKANIFEYVAYINAEKNCSLDNAMEDAINIGIQDVEEVQEDDTKYFQFKCTPDSMEKMLTQLKKLGYEVVSMSEDCIPLVTVELSESDLTNIDNLRKRLFDVEGVDEIYDNIVHN